MSNDLVETLSAGELQPFDPGMPVLAPLQPDTWGTTDVDLLHEHQHQPQNLAFFGTVLPSGITEAQVQSRLHDIGERFGADFQALGYPSDLTWSAVTFFKENALKPPQQVRRQHQFKLPDVFVGDWLAESFGNHLQGLAGTKHQKQQFLDASLTWLAKLAKYASSQNPSEGSGDIAQGSAPNFVDPTEQLTDQQYNQLVEHNNQVQAKTMQVLQDRWGEYTFRQNIEIAQNYLNNLPANERAHFSRYTGSFPWTHMLNTVECLTALFDMATGAHSIPKNGPDISREIAECERCMKTNRKQWLGDPALQARYRTLLTLRDGH